MNNVNPDFSQNIFPAENPAYPELSMQNPAAMQPDMMQPNMVQPGMMQPDMMQPNMMQPGMVQPNMVFQPEMVVPGSIQANPNPQPEGGSGDPEVSIRTENEPVKVRTFAHPALVLFLMILFFPAGLIAMLFFTKWGGFAKTFITIFVLAVALALYEILVLYNVIDLPSVIGMISGVWNDFINI